MPHKQPPKEHQWKKGQSGNLKGRPPGTLKDYMRQKLKGMTEEEKEKFIKDIPKELQWRMAEGNPEQEQKHSGDLTIQIEQSLADKYNVESSARDNSDRQT